jgi:hypothetical protein
LIIDGNRMYRGTVERDSMAAPGRKLAASTGSGGGTLYLGGRHNNHDFVEFESQIDQFFNRNPEEGEHIFNLNNQYFIHLCRLREHIQLCHLEWCEQVTGNQYRNVNQGAFVLLRNRIDELIGELGELMPISAIERRAGGIRMKGDGQQQLYIRPVDAETSLGWQLLRESILRVSIIEIERLSNDDGGFDYYFSLRIHPGFQEILGEGNFPILEQLVLNSPEFNPQSAEDTRRTVERTVNVREGQAQFRDRIRQAYGDICAITGCNDERGMQAAHIRPYRGTYTNHVTNGMLLRIDIHRLFDHPNGPFLRIEIDEDTWRIRIDESLIGTTYEQYDGTELNLPQNPAHRPNIEAVRNAGWLVN